jgi:GTP cyclohydrolase I
MATKFTDAQDIKHSLKEAIRFIGDNPDREGLKETPDRMIRSWGELFSGYEQDVSEYLKCFSEGSCDEMVILKDIEFYSTCEHHFLPFYGTANIGYIPNGKVLGVSKLARIADVFAKRLQIQERMTTQIADTIYEGLNAKGVIVVCKAVHFCMTSRGIRKQNSEMVTSAIRGIFSDNETARNEFLTLTKG